MKKNWIAGKDEWIDYLDGRGETARVFGGRDDQLVDVRLSQVFKVQIFGQPHVARRRTNVERSGSLAVGFQRVADLSLGERFRPHRDDAATHKFMWKLYLLNFTFSII